ncbi:MAG: phosphoglucosamine mutase [Ignavibacteria bacterium 13_1_40CM_2_61_4]|nr:MAG: phosphoglucosamine mutase [Ignavibacteria bacterium 13_1_40CM_2_61_4]
MSLMVSISGIRGVVGESLTPEVIVKYARSFAQYSNRGAIVIGRDGRVSGKIVGNIVASTLLAAGCDVVALGIVPTPTIGIAVEQLGAAGGISVTASHNPIEWNGLKFIGADGMFLDGDANSRLWKIAETPGSYAHWNELGEHTTNDSFIERHIGLVLHLPFFDADLIRRRKFKVVADCVHGAGGRIVPQLLRELGCDVVELNCDCSGLFSRNPEPVPENLVELRRRVTAEQADCGIAVDPDADRLALVDEKGEAFGEELTVTTAVRFILEKLGSKRGPAGAGGKPTVVVNLSTTRAVDDVARKFGAEVVRTPVGEINVAKKMKELGAVVGGEGSGGVILPVVHYTRDAIAGIGLIMQQLAEFGGTLSAFKATMPRYSMVKTKVSVENRDPDSVLKAIRKEHAKNGNVNTDDGLKLSFDDSWVHLRRSNTEPIIRIIAEAPTSRKAEELSERFGGLLRTAKDRA